MQNWEHTQAFFLLVLRQGLNRLRLASNSQSSGTSSLSAVGITGIRTTLSFKAFFQMTFIQMMRL